MKNVEKRKASMRAYYEANKEVYKNRSRAWRAAHPEIVKVWERRYHEKHREKRNAVALARYYELYKEPTRAKRLQFRKDAIAAYGGKCQCCGEVQEEFLSIDHVNNDGANHRRKIGSEIYRWLKNNGYPKEGFQVLCYNCNCAKEFSGYCPHAQIEGPKPVRRSIRTAMEVL